ncbi:lycopene cyclase family protein [Actinacidiphila sp. bgisy167]|uniref:lycopene cyclase family protein n=1 Tax=Actinacidiphila sp. bgisy167 TaxID=3413797 RepID=UPI003D72C784
MTDAAADVLIVGAGAAGLSLARRLTASAKPDDHAPPSVIIVEPPRESLVRSPDRTWCFWESEPGEYDDSLVTARWNRLRITTRDGRRMLVPSQRAYKMIRSVDFLREVGGALANRPCVRMVEATVTGVRDTCGGADVSASDSSGRPIRLSARWVFDSRPPQAMPAARTTLLQHFRGWFVTTREERFEPDVADLMDFRTRQPERGLSFAYVLPFSPREALVEYTEFSDAPLPESTYDAALEAYLDSSLPLGGFHVTGIEQGVIPMTDGDFPRRDGEHVFRIGVAGGATRPSTGYAFAAIQRQSAAIAAAWRAGRIPEPPQAHAARHRLMDAVMLRALATGRAGPAFFEDLFRRNPPDRVLRFLDGTSTPRDEWRIGLSTPVPAMLRSLLELPLIPRRRATT